jgi:hypothetical protein
MKKVGIVLLLFASGMAPILIASKTDWVEQPLSTILALLGAVLLLVSFLVANHNPRLEENPRGKTDQGTLQSRLTGAHSYWFGRVLRTGLFKPVQETEQQEDRHYRTVVSYRDSEVLLLTPAPRLNRVQLQEFDDLETDFQMFLKRFSQSLETSTTYRVYLCQDSENRDLPVYYLEIVLSSIEGFETVLRMASVNTAGNVFNKYQSLIEQG